MILKLTSDNPGGLKGSMQHFARKEKVKCCIDRLSWQPLSEVALPASWVEGLRLPRLFA